MSKVTWHHAAGAGSGERGAALTSASETPALPLKGTPVSATGSLVSALAFRTVAAAALVLGSVAVVARAVPPLDLGAVSAETVRRWDAAAGVTHKIIIDAPQTQVLRVETTVTGVTEPTLDFHLPAWRPGRYVVLDFAGGVRTVSAVAADGSPLPVHKTDKSTWRVQISAATAPAKRSSGETPDPPYQPKGRAETTPAMRLSGETPGSPDLPDSPDPPAPPDPPDSPDSPDPHKGRAGVSPADGGAAAASPGTIGGNTVTLRYEIYANDLKLRTRHVDDTHAFLDGSAVFMLVDGRRERPQRVVLDLPDGWQVSTGLDAVPGQSNTLAAPDYDTLIDAPLELGRQRVVRFMVDGHPHELAIWGQARLDADKLAADLKTIAATQHSFWGEVPYGRFVWLLHVGAGLRGGTEHLNSTIMQVGPDAFAPAKRYRRFLGLVSHEFFHTWNVKRLRPAGLDPYDLSRENYTDLLWVSEGTTSYYGSLLLVRAGLVEPDDYLKQLAEAIDGYRRRPGRGVQSVAQASFDAWIKFNKPNPDTENSTVSFYRAGSLVSFALDMELRARTDNRVSLDDILRSAYEQFPLGSGQFTRENLLVLLHEQSGTRFDEFFDDFVTGTRALPIEEALRIVGLDLRPPEPQPADEDDEPHGPRADLGLRLRHHDGLARVTTVLADGPAYAAGVEVDDLIVTLDGRRLRASDLDRRLRQYESGQTVRLTLLRRDWLRSIDVTLGETDPRKPEIVRLEHPTDMQRRAYASWLGQPWPVDSEDAP